VPKTIRLAIFFNDELRAVKKLAVPFVIGRSHDANLTIPHPMVSRRHCLIFQEKGTFHLQDLGSLNGIWQGRERITDLELQDGAEFLIGTIRFVFNPADTLEPPVSSAIPDSDIVKAEVILELPDDLPPPLPPPGFASFPQPIPVPLPTAQIVPKPPNFIKPFPQFSPIHNDAGGILELHDVIDLAEITDKEASTPPPIRVRK
jgi:pSer/pThr/pTyr-binding forkhead associated (FHA) protein